MSEEFEENALGTGALGDLIFGPDIEVSDESTRLRLVYVKVEDRTIFARSDTARTVYAPVSSTRAIARSESRTVYTLAERDRSVSGSESRVVTVATENRSVTLRADLEIEEVEVAE